MKPLDKHIEDDSIKHLEMEHRLTRLEILLYVNIGLSILGIKSGFLLKLIGGS